MIRRIVVAVLWTLTVLAVLNVWGVGLSGVWAVLVSIITVIGVGFLATWTMISNFTASFILVLWRPFHFGQTVEILPENLKGQVTDRNLMFTTLREESGTVRMPPSRPACVSRCQR
jgi:small-conductance mechanosensitive channel